MLSIPTSLTESDRPYEPLKDVLLLDRITLRRQVSTPASDLQVLKAQYGVELKPTKVEPSGGVSTAFFTGAELFTAFVALTEDVVKMFTGQIPFSHESGDEVLGPDERWELLFAGREQVMVKGFLTPRRVLTVRNEENIVSHLWRLPDAGALLEMMSRLRSNVSYSILQKFIRLEDQSILTPTVDLSGLTPTANGGPGLFLKTHVRIGQTIDIYEYMNKTNDAEIHKKLGWDLLAFFQALTGNLNSFDHIWQLPYSASDFRDLGKLEKSLQAIEDNYQTWLNDAAEVSRSVFVAMPYNPVWGLGSG